MWCYQMEYANLMAIVYEVARLEARFFDKLNVVHILIRNVM